MLQTGNPPPASSGAPHGIRPSAESPHGRVADGTRREWSLPHDAIAARLARGHVDTALADWKLNTPVDDLVLMVSELVANAIEHGSAPLTLSLRCGAEPDGAATLSVEVTDGGSDIPPQERSLDADPLDDHGRGLAIVSALADRWGVVKDDEGTTAWSVLRIGG